MHPQLDQILRPGVHTVVIDSFTELEDRIMAHMVTHGGVCLTVGINKPRMYSLRDLYDFKYRPMRCERNRHHKRKPQPNCGPRGSNSW